MSSILVVQRGHVPRKSGATGAPGEQAMARRVASMVESMVSKVDKWSVNIIDADEQNSRYKGDAFVSVHGDANANPKAGGFSFGHRNTQGRDLANAIRGVYGQLAPFDGRKDNYTTNLSRYYGTAQAVSAENPRATIMEVGFMTNPDERQWIDSEEGTQAIAASIWSGVAGIDVRDLLIEASKPIPVKVTPPRSRAPSSTSITLDDKGSDVKAWQNDLIKLLGQRWLPRYGADGHFGEETRRATVEAMRQLGLISRASDPKRPIVGPRTRTAMAKALKKNISPWRGKKVRAKVNLRFYDSPRWTNPVGTMKAGHHFPVIEARIAVGGGYQYRVRNSRGVGPFYITASSKFVDLI